SADNHAAALMRALRNADVDLRFIGRGGPQMKAVAGANFQDWIEKSGVLGLWEVIKHYGYFRKQFHETLYEIDSSKPTAVPMIERLREHKIDIERDPNVIGLFPGSRAREVRKIFPILIETARELRQSKPNLRFEVAAASDELAQEMRKMLGDSLATPHLNPLPSSRGEGRVRGDFESEGSELRDRSGGFDIKVGQTAEIMQRAFVGIVASGSATLEAAYFRMPFALIYKVAWPTYFAGRLLVKVKYLGMPNVLADKEVVPEFIQHRAQPHNLASAVLRLL